MNADGFMENPSRQIFGEKEKRNALRLGGEGNRKGEVAGNCKVKLRAEAKKKLTNEEELKVKVTWKDNSISWKTLGFFSYEHGCFLPPRRR